MFGVCLVIDRNAACVVPVTLLPPTMPHEASRQWRRLLPDCPLICSLHISMTVNSGQLHCSNSSKSFNYNLPTLSLQQHEHTVKAITRIYFWGVFGGRDSEAHRAEARGPKGQAGVRFLGRGRPAPSPPAGGSGGAL